MNQMDNYGALKDISTLREILQLLTVNSESNPALPNRLISQVIRPDTHIYGTDVEYHQLIKTLREMGEHFLALEVCRFLLNSAPIGAVNREALSKALIICAECPGLFQEGESFFRLAEPIKPFWSHNLYYGVIRFLRSLLEVYPFNKELTQKTNLLTNDYLSRFPGDKRAYRQRAEFLRDVGRKEETATFLRHYLFETRFPIDAHCCVLLMQLLEQEERFDWTDSYEIISKLLELAAADAGADREDMVLMEYAAIEAKYRKALADENTGVARDALTHISEIRNHTWAQKESDKTHHTGVSEHDYEYQDLIPRQDLLVKYRDSII